MKTHSRREFLTKTALGSAALLGFPTVIPSSVLGESAPSNRVNLGFIGVGRRGFGIGTHDFLALADARTVAVADCFASRRNAFAAKMNEHYGTNVCQPYADHREVLAREDIDGVVIATPDHWHAPLAQAAAEAGKDIYLEKPLSVSMHAAMGLRKAIADNGRIFQYGTQQRSFTGAQLAVDLVRNGYIGEVERVDVWSPCMGDRQWGLSAQTKPVPDDLDYGRWIGPAPMKPYSDARCSFRGSTHCYDYSLGHISGWGAHPLDILQWGMEDGVRPVSCEGTGTLPPEGDLFDTLRSWDLHLKCEDGMPLRFMSMDVANPVVMDYHFAWKLNGTTFHGDEGWVSYSRGACYMFMGGKRVNPTKIVFKGTDKRVRASRSHASDFVACIKSREPTMSPIESAVRGDTISHLGNICVRIGRPLTWDPATESIAGDEDASKMLDRPQREWLAG